MTSVLELVDIRYSYPKAARTSPGVLDGVSATITKGEAVGVVGDNGSGKSTLLKIVASLLRPTSGEVRYLGTPLSGNPVRYRSALSYCAGAPLGFYPRLTAAENMRFFSGMKGRMCSAGEVFELLAQVGLKDSHDVNYAKFSLGMRQRLHLACLLLEPSDVWILDEPTTGLDTSGVLLLEKLLANAPDKVKLIVSHDHDFLCRVTSRQLTLKQGRLACSGSSSS